MWWDIGISRKSFVIIFWEPEDKIATYERCSQIDGPEKISTASFTDASKTAMIVGQMNKFSPIHVFFLSLFDNSSLNPLGTDAHEVNVKEKGNYTYNGVD